MTDWLGAALRTASCRMGYFRSKVTSLKSKKCVLENQDIKMANTHLGKLC